MSLRTERRARTAPLSASATATATATESDAIREAPPVPDGTLRLRGAAVHERRVVWAEDVVDNEGLGRKSSKVCCIYHKPRAVDESSDESSGSDSSSDSDSDGQNEGARPSRRLAKKTQKHKHHDSCEGHEATDDAEPEADRSQELQSRRHATTTVRRRSPNAYEKMPKPKAGH